MSSSSSQHYSYDIPNAPAVPPDFNVLMQAIGNCAGPVIHQLLVQNLQLIKMKGWHGQTALHRACLGGDYTVIYLLLQAGADPNARNDFDETPMHYASKRGVAHVLCLMIQQGGDVTVEDRQGRKLAHHAAETGSVYMLHFLSAATGTTFQDVDAKLQSPLHIVCGFGHMDAFKYLIKKGRSDLTQADIAGNTPLHVCAMEGYSHMTWLLLMATGLQGLHVTNKDGYTPADLAGQRDKFGHREISPVLRYFQELKDQTQKPKGPILVWCWHLLMPGVIYAVCVLLAHLIGHGFQGVFVTVGLAYLIYLLKQHVHRIKHVCRWPNPVYAGTFGAGLFHTFIVYYFSVFPYMKQYTFHLFATPVLTITVMALFCKVLIMDPGTVNQSLMNEVTRQPTTIQDLCVPPKKVELFCISCEIVRPARTKHCKICEKCFQDMDHHCLFLLKCIARRNHALFVWFIFFCLVSMVFFLVSVVLYCRDTFSQFSPWEIFVHHFQYDAWLLSMCALNVISILWGSNLLLFQFRMISKGHTTYFKPKQDIDVLSFTEKFMNVAYFLAGRKPFMRNPFLNVENIM